MEDLDEDIRGDYAAAAGQGLTGLDDAIKEAMKPIDNYDDSDSDGENDIDAVWEREKAQKDAGSEEATAFALQLLVQKAKDETGLALFKAGEIAELKNEVRDADLQSLMLAVITGNSTPTEEEAKK